MTHFWIYQIHDNFGGNRRRLIAEYVAETSWEAVGLDLASPRSLLRGFLGALDVDAEEFVEENPLLAESLLGGLLAISSCSLEFAVLTPGEPPPAIQVAKPRNAGRLVRFQHEVRVWRRETELDERRDREIETVA